MLIGCRLMMQPGPLIEFRKLRRHRADELVERTGIARRDALDLVDALGFDRTSLLREARMLAGGTA